MFQGKLDRVDGWFRRGDKEVHGVGWVDGSEEGIKRYVVYGGGVVVVDGRLEEGIKRCMR